MTTSDNKPFSASLDDYYETLNKARKLNSEMWDSDNILTRVYKLFVTQHLRQSVWDEVYRDYLEDRYPVGSKGRKGRETNLPRDIWQSDNYTWYNFKLGLMVLTYAFKHIDIQFVLDIENSKARSWVFNVNRMTEENDSVPVLVPGNGPFVTDKTKRDLSLEPPLVYIVRDLLYAGQYTKTDVREMVSAMYPNLPRNSLHNKRGAAIQSVCRGSITWDSALHIFKMLRVKGLTVAIRASNDGRAFNTTQAMRIV